MFRIATSQLPPEQQKRLHSDFLANEKAYLQMRDQLLPHYQGKWVAIHDGKVIAADDDLLKTMEISAQQAGHPYIVLVGGEDTVVFRTRRVEHSYDLTYRPFPIPRIAATFLNHSESHSQVFSNVILDTGADVSVLPTNDCSAIDLFNSPYLPAYSSGVVGPGAATLVYRAKVEIDGKRVAALVEPISGGQERLIGREILNQFPVLFDGPGKKVVFHP